MHQSQQVESYKMSYNSIQYRWYNYGYITGAMTFCDFKANFRKFNANVCSFRYMMFKYFKNDLLSLEKIVPILQALGLVRDTIKEVNVKRLHY